jgi:hypothetical protein
MVGLSSDPPLTPALSPCCVSTVRVVHGAREDWAASWVGLGTAARTPLTQLTFQIKINGHATFLTNVQTQEPESEGRISLQTVRLDPFQCRPDLVPQT